MTPANHITYARERKTYPWGVRKLSYSPKVLVISSCSDTKTQPPGELGKRSRKIKKELVEYSCKLQELMQEDVEANEVRARINDLRYELSTYMLLEDDFEPSRLAQREAELSSYISPAADMYAGDHHQEIMRGIDLLRETYGKDCVDLKIISAGYGLLDENDRIAPYDATFSGLDGAAIDRKASALGIHADVEGAIAPYDLVIFLLGKEYLRSVRLPIVYDKGRQRLLFIASGSAQEFLDYDLDYGLVIVGNEEVHDLGSAAVSLKGKVFHLFSQVVARDGWQVMQGVKSDPSRFLGLLDQFRKPKPESQGASVLQTNIFDNPGADPAFAHNTSFSMSYFMPENEDRVDGAYDPWAMVSEARTGGRTHLTDKYAHEILRVAPWDGFLMSLHEVSGWTGGRKEDIFRLGAREYLRYPKEKGLILGDCGAFTFNEKGQPPFTNRQVLEQYRALGVDMGVSVDYLIFPDDWGKDAVEAQRRFELNLESAQDFWDTWREMSRASSWRFVPVGVAQGGTPERLAQAVTRLQEIGYRYIAIGGLAKSPASYIEKCLRVIAPTVGSETQLHLFGFGKLEQINYYRQLGVTSFDSTSSLLQAFTRAVYWDPTQIGRHYAAIRVPITDGRKARAMAKTEKRDLQTSRRLEKETLVTLRKYDETGSQADLIAARNALTTYDLFLSGGWPYNPHMRDSFQTLEERPWKRCDCAICREWGIAVAILRSNNHNRRRGFHNTWVFYQEKIRRVGPGMTQEQFDEFVRMHV